jgi:hypothetical protein
MTLEAAFSSLASSTKTKTKTNTEHRNSHNTYKLYRHPIPKYHPDQAVKPPCNLNPDSANVQGTREHHEVVAQARKGSSVNLGTRAHGSNGTMLRLSSRRRGC